MIEVRHISKSFGDTQAVKNLSFKVNRSETLILLGTSGCGKTTTLKMINQLITTDSGSIFIDGKNIQDVKPEKLRIGMGYVLQNHGLFPHYTIAQNISIVPQLLKWEISDTNKRVDELLDKLHLSSALKNKHPHQLSGGQQQRVGLARALAANPPILLMDEPLGALDPITRDKIRKEFLTLDELQDKTIVMVTHDIQEAFELGDRICLMDKGELLQIGTPQELLRNPENEKVNEFFSGQQLQLSFKNISLIDIWKYLPHHETRESHLKILAESHSVWSAMELLAEKNEISLEWNGERKMTSSSGLMLALENYKNQADGTAK